MRTLIKGGTVVTAADTFLADVLVEDGKIASLSARFAGQVDETVDAAGRYVFPGGIDVHTHLDMPFGGSFSSDDFETGTIAAAHGGTTTVVDFAIQSRGQSLRAGLDAWHAKAEGKAAVDYGFHMIATDLPPAALDEMAALVADGVTSFKLFMAYPGVLLLDDQSIFRAMLRARELGALVCMHAEAGLALDVLVQRALARGETAPIHHALTRPEASESSGTERTIALAEMAGAPCYIVHLTAERALARVKEARDRGLPVFAETCPQYLYLSEDDLRGKPADQGGEFEGAKYVCSPPLRPAHHHEHLWRALANHDLAVVSTDHCPFNYRGQKELGRQSFAKIPNGMPGIEDRLYLMWEGVRAGRLSANRFVDVCATTPAKLFGLYPRKGTVAVGADADLVVWDPERKHVLSARSHHMRVDYNAYEGREVTGAPAHVFSRGRTVVKDGKFLGRAGHGQYLRRGTWAP